MLGLFLRRLAVIPVQVVGVVSLVFVLVRLLPSPAHAIAGPLATKEQIKLINHQYGFDQPVTTQYLRYMRRVAHGDLGYAWHTGNPVLDDIRQRAPATLELISLALIGIAILSVVCAAVTSMETRRLPRRIVSIYGFVGGALPDFWIGLALIFFVYYILGWAPEPTGQLSLRYAVPNVTGSAVIDSILAGDTAATINALQHLVLPVLTLMVVYSGILIRVTAGGTSRALDSDFVQYATAWGIAPWRRTYYAFRQVLPTFVITLAVVYGNLLGGAVLVETVFSWGGLGQYAVNGLSNSDFSAIEGFIIVAGVFTIVVYTIAEMAEIALDPRSRR